MSKPEDKPGDASQATPSRGRRDGVIAPHPWPDQEARKQMSDAITSHPSKRLRNRDWETLPRGSLVTDP